MKSYLCALDFTEGAESFLKAAARLAVANNAQLTILYPYRLLLPGPEEDALTTKKKILNGAQNRFLELEKKLKLTGKLIYNFKPEIGFLYDRLELWARKHEVDTVILSQRQSSLFDEHSGRTTKQLLGDLNVDFVVIGEGGKT